MCVYVCLSLLNDKAFLGKLHIIGDRISVDDPRVA